MLFYDMDYKCMLLVVLASHIGALKSEVCAFDSFFSCLHQKIGSNHSMVVVYNYTEWANKIVVWFISLGRQIEQQKVELLVQKLLQFALLFVLFCCFYIYNNSNNNTHTLIQLSALLHLWHFVVEWNSIWSKYCL